MNKVEVIYFPKLCPHCQRPLTNVQGMSHTRLECLNGKCPYIQKMDGEPYMYARCRR